MKKITYEIEWNLERSHWWFTGRRRLLKSILSHLNIKRTSSVIDVGCGVGSNLNLLESMGFNVIGIDSEIYSLFLAKRHLPTVSLVNGNLTRLPFKDDSIGLVIATDILEHLSEDTMGIKEIYRILEREGTVIFTVPALRFLKGVQDIVGMHKRRYSKRELTRKIGQEGFKVLRSSYFNFFLFFPILIARRMIHLFGLRIDSENEINSPITNFFLKSIFSLEPQLLKYFSFPFGVSIFCVAKRMI